MGAIQRTPSVNKLSEWICKVKVKKRAYCRKNLFINAVLTNTLVHAKHLLRAKQRERKQRWQKMKSTLPTKTQALQRSINAAAICEELSSLDDFMYKLSQIKVPLRR